MNPSAKRFFSSVFSGLALAMIGFALLAEEPPTKDHARSDAQFTRQLVGAWEDQYQGHRIMTVRPDGTATMVVELHGWKAALYASRLQFEMVWSVEQGRMKKRTVGGEPAGRVNAVLKMMGDHVTEQILELTEERLVLLDQDGKRQYHWTRVKTSKPQ